MPGWGDRGQHEGGWCKVREGREEEGGKGEIAGSEISVRQISPPCLN